MSTVVGVDSSSGAELGQKKGRKKLEKKWESSLVEVV